MEHTISKLGKFSSESIRQAARRTETDLKAINDMLVPMLKILQAEEISLTKQKSTSSKVKNSMIKPSDQQIFDENILPSIQKKMDDIDNKMKKDDFSWELNFAYDKHFGQMNESELNYLHENVCKQENTATRLKLVAQYHRGLIYQAAKQNNIHLDVSRPTMRKYATFAALIAAWPMLLICDLSFNQIIKHKDRLMQATLKDNELQAALSQNIEFKAQGTHMTIKVCEDEMSFPPGAMCIDADASILETYETPSEDHDNWDFPILPSNELNPPFVNDFDLISVD